MNAELPPSQECPDAELLDRVARARDPRAFDLFYQRYARRALGLAYRITSSTEQAEEALQQAMLRIWLGAKGFDGRQSALKWTLKIVAHECVSILNQDRRWQKRVDSQPAPQGAAFGPVLLAENAATADETLSRLQQLLATLPLQDQRMLALSCGAGLSQRQIARFLGIPQQTVSFRIAKSLEKLRLQLGGVASHLCTPAFLSQALCRHPLPVPALPENFFEQAAAGKSLSFSRTPLLTSCVLTAIIAAVFGLRPNVPRPTDLPEPKIGGVASIDARRSDHKPEKFFRRWSFGSGMPNDLVFEKDAWTWRENKTDPKRSVMVPLTKKLSGLRVPVKLPVGPCLMTLKVLMTDSSGGYIFGLSPKPGKSSPLSTWKSDKLLWEEETDGTYIFKIYCIADRWCISMHNGKLYGVTRYNSSSFSFSEQTILLWAKTLAFAEIELRELATEEIPDFIRDPAKLSATLGIRLLESKGMEALKTDANSMP